MPGLPILDRETPSGDADQMCCQDSPIRMSAEEKAAAEESLSAYCKPVELYNLLHHRAFKKPLFLQRCLRYKLEARHTKRIQLTVSLYVPGDNELEIQPLFPLYIMLAKSASEFSIAEQSARHYFKRCFTLSTFAGDEGTSRFMARFVLPESNMLLAEIKSGSFAILFIGCAQGGECMLGRAPMELIDLTCGRSPNLSEESETILTVDLRPCVIETSVDDHNCVSFRAAPTHTISASKQRLEVIFTAEEIGAEDLLPLGSYSGSDVPSSSLSHITRLRNGHVVFNYLYYNNKLQRTEVTEGFSCPFCLMKCASFKGLKCHLLAFHDLFKFEFRAATDGNHVVNVYVKIDSRRSEWHQMVADGVDAKKQTFFYRSKTRRRPTKNIFQTGNNVRPPVPESDHHPMETSELYDVSVDCGTSDQNTARVSHETAPSADPESTVPLPESSITTVRSTRSRKRSVRREPSIGSLLQRRQFFHSRQAQPMAIEQVLSEFDSEDEKDCDIADLEDRRMLDDFVDVTNDEKQLMQMWNSFVRRQRVLADGHVPWACEHFSRLHAAYLVDTPTMLKCWRLFMIKLWYHGLLNAQSLNTCNQILYSWQNEQHNTNLGESHDIDDTNLSVD